MFSIADLVSFQSCEDRCYRDMYPTGVSSHESSDSLESRNRYPRPKFSPSAESLITDQTLRLGDYLFEQIATPEENPGPKLRSVELFKRSVQILSKHCAHPFVHSNFINRLLYGFLFLVTDAGIGNVEDISVEEFEEISRALDSCDEKPPDFRLEGDICDNHAIVSYIILHSKILSRLVQDS